MKQIIKRVNLDLVHNATRKLTMKPEEESMKELISHEFYKTNSNWNWEVYTYFEIDNVLYQLKLDVGMLNTVKIY